MGTFSLAASVAVAIVALLHVAFFVLESFLWTRPFGRRVFGLTAEAAENSRALAINQGLYNAFLAAGLVWSFVAPADCAVPIAIFFLACVVVAGIVGAMTAKWSILFVQALPGLVALLLVLFTRR